MLRTTPELPIAAALFARLDALGIAHHTLQHVAVFTVAESQGLRGSIAGAHAKNLFVKDKKDNYFLMTVEEHATVDLKTIHSVIGAERR